MTRAQTLQFESDLQPGVCSTTDIVSYVHNHRYYVLQRLQCSMLLHLKQTASATQKLRPVTLSDVLAKRKLRSCTASVFRRLPQALKAQTGASYRDERGIGSWSTMILSLCHACCFSCMQDMFDRSIALRYSHRHDQVSCQAKTGINVRAGFAYLLPKHQTAHTSRDNLDSTAGAWFLTISCSSSNGVVVGS